MRLRDQDRRTPSLGPDTDMISSKQKLVLQFLSRRTTPGSIFSISHGLEEDYFPARKKSKGWGEGGRIENPLSALLITQELNRDNLRWGKHDELLPGPHMSGMILISDNVQTR